MAEPWGAGRGVAVVVDHDRLSKYAAGLLAELAALPGVQVRALLVAPRPRMEAATWLARVENLNLRRYATHGDHRSRSALPELPTRRLTEARLTDRDAAWLAEQGVELVVDVALAGVRGPTGHPGLRVITWSLGSGWPVGWREVALRRAATPLRILLHEGDRPARVLFAGEYTTKWFGLFNEASIATFGLPHLIDAVRRVLAEEADSVGAPSSGPTVEGARGPRSPMPGPSPPGWPPT